MKKEVKFAANHETLKNSIIAKTQKLEQQHMVDPGTSQMIMDMAAAFEKVVERGPDGYDDDEIEEHIQKCFAVQEAESMMTPIFGLGSELSDLEAAELYAWHEVNLDMATDDEDGDEPLLGAVQDDWARKSVLLIRAADAAGFIQTVRYRDFLNLKKEEGPEAAWEMWRDCKVVYGFLRKAIDGLLIELE